MAALKASSSKLEGSSSKSNDDHRARLEGCTEQARKQQQTLQDAKRLVAEMDDMGEDTKAQLRKQREGLEKNIDDVRDTSEEVSKAQSMLSKLTKRFGLW
uniref:t-SNARE coiled-coil homology domain-containing protein n=1 Tax=Eutreptiella gymnastica TaxID=73025 RepID=A0A7S4G380_9EUGL|mmetsp:Transcript_88900/g.148288  ORF Transcript_88900/g.148288 Transcript_88900/m.148288 type:complete len:100 (+) Transcript_88900:62-361(+)|eukprot:CAMPEP_0174380664 /NCGR_PEP_ID=MMETSP0811_2-20130205/123518_1 /TAXON_ID=73025 ORGANISM="Eutreptiella gymnastica-like, Strain CCMP1594" /NCGR_SAMPLE_ID=MMETSP0811_2 /ASSEMBLY_ACC=CAM_ASM_000667 /LENGTH=99 /DNA_ID=CAMNT_0015533591 /DNA_START=62 /DNA_END=361 /DNA_ORIENTATION=-